MKYIKSYEGLFDFFKKNPVILDTTEDIKKKHKLFDVIRKQSSEITEEIVDSMWDIFDKYEISQLPQEDSQILPREIINIERNNETGLYWYYNYDELYHDTTYGRPIVKCGIIIHVYTKQINIQNIFDDIMNIVPTIEGRTGIRLNVSKPSSKDQKSIIIYFPLSYASLRNSLID